MVNVTVQVKGIDEISKKFGAFPPQLRAYLARAGRKYAPVLLDEQGVRKYPPQGAGNLPPTPYYVRGVGTQYATYNAGNSQQATTRFVIQSRGNSTVIDNSATYAKHLWGAYTQARAMARIGWTKLIDAAKKTRPQMVRIFSEEVNNALKALRLK